MKKTILMYESDKENHIGTTKAEGELLELIAGAGTILMNVSKMAAKALDEEPEDMVTSIACATLYILTHEKKGEANE